MENLLSHPIIVTLLAALSHPVGLVLLPLLLTGAGVLILRVLNKRSNRVDAKRLADIESWERFQGMAPLGLADQFLHLDAWSGFPKAALYSLDHLERSYSNIPKAFHDSKLAAKASKTLLAARKFNDRASILCIDVGDVFRTRPRTYREDQEERFEAEAIEVQQLAFKVGQELRELYALAKRRLVI